ncbi:MAG: hypothetical protein WBG86_16420, partial [Polyangiales bacterium]
EKGLTFVTIDSGPHYPVPEISCANDPPPPEYEVTIGDPCEFLDGECQMFLDPPAGPCTMTIRVRDQETGELICEQEEDFVVSEVGDTELDITVDCFQTP